jgi:hypothetical protein
MDASGVGAFMRGLVAVLEDRPLLPHLEGDPWASINNSAGPHRVSDLEGWTTYGPTEFMAAAEAERVDFENDGPIEQRTIYFPAGEIERLKAEAMDQIRGAGLEVRFLSSGDVIVAWLYKVLISHFGLGVSIDMWRSNSTGTRGTRLSARVD